MVRSSSMFFFVWNGKLIPRTIKGLLLVPKNERIDNLRKIQDSKGTGVIEKLACSCWTDSGGVGCIRTSSSMLSSDILVKAPSDLRSTTTQKFFTP